MTHRPTVQSDIDLFKEIVGAMCVRPRVLTVTAVDFGGVIFTIACHEQDYGAVLGSRAKNLKALRTVAAELMAKHDRQVPEDEIVKLEEQTNPDAASHKPFKASKTWDRDTVERIALAVGASVMGGRQQAEFVNINSFTTGLMLVCDNPMTDRLVQALGIVLDCIAARHGHHVRFRTASMEKR